MFPTELSMPANRWARNGEEQQQARPDTLQPAAADADATVRRRLLVMSPWHHHSWHCDDVHEFQIMKTRVGLMTILHISHKLVADNETPETCVHWNPWLESIINELSEKWVYFKL